MSSNDKANALMKLELEEGEEPELFQSNPEFNGEKPDSTLVTRTVLDVPVYEVEEEEEPPYKKRCCQSPVPAWITDLLNNAENLYNTKKETTKEKEANIRKEIANARRKRDENLRVIATRKRPCDDSSESPLKRRRLDIFSPLHA
jgi:hypothetical protein